MTGTGIAVGLRKGYPLTKRTPRARPSNTKGKLGKRVALVRNIIKEVAGLAPYEKRLSELLKVRITWGRLRFSLRPFFTSSFALRTIEYYLC